MLGHGRHPSSRSSPAFPHPAGQGRGRRRARATAPSPAARPAPPRRVPRSPLGRRRPQLADWAQGAAGRGRAGNFAAAGGAAPPGASASVRVTEGLLGAAAERGTKRKVASASGGRGGRGPSRSRLWRPKLQRGAPRTLSNGAAAALLSAAGLASGLRFLLPAPVAAAAFADGRVAAAAAASQAGRDH